MRQPAYNRKVFSVAVVLLLSGCSGKDEALDPAFDKTTLFSDGNYEAPWAKFTGDSDHDGSLEFYVGYHGNGELVRLAYGQGVEKLDFGLEAVQTDGGVADIDGDGRSDLVVLTPSGIAAIGTARTGVVQLFPGRFHDILFLDENDDGQLEIVVRNQTAFGNGSGDIRILTRTDEAGHWNDRTLATMEGEGIAAADLDADGDIDIVAAPVWLENLDGREWAEHVYTESWDWPHTKIAVGDLDGDGRNDIVLAPAEPEGQRYRVSWFYSSDDPRAPWIEEVLVDDIESVVHALQAGDLDLDGDVDLVYAEMHQGADPDEVVVLENRGQAAAWRKRIIDRGGSHNLQLFDWDGDGDLDIAGANWDGENQDVVLWTNHVCDAPWSVWQRHEIDSARPGQAVFVLASDLNGDEYPDVVAGSMAYLNPGLSRDAWQPLALGTPASDAAALLDVNGDGMLDVLVAIDEENRRRFEVLQNDGVAGFITIETGVSMSGDFLQGVANVSDARNLLAFSWHAAGQGIELLRLPEAEGETGGLSRISDYSQDEDLSAGDIDGDGDVDLLLGTAWLRNDGEDWSLQPIDEQAPAPDRNELADLDGDGDLDAVVGFEAISEQGDIAWYESHKGAWVRHQVAAIVGPMSLDVADIDGDGDLDIIAGEHNLKDPDSAALWIFENLDGLGQTWNEHLIHIGDEHHDGAQTVDIDLDGDLDIVSIGWGHDDVIWYENKMPACPNNTQSGD